MIRKVSEINTQTSRLKTKDRWESQKDYSGKQYVPEKQRGTMIKEIYERLCHVGWKFAPVIRSLLTILLAKNEGDYRKAQKYNNPNGTIAKSRIPCLSSGYLSLGSNTEKQKRESILTCHHRHAQQVCFDPPESWHVFIDSSLKKTDVF